MNPPNGFHWITEDRRRSMLDRRADERAERQRRATDRLRVQNETQQSIDWYRLGDGKHQGQFALDEQERTADKLRQAGMVVR